MSIDDKLGPIATALGPLGRAYHRIDDEVHRYYEKIVSGWEAGGRERKHLAFYSYFAAVAAAVFAGQLIDAYPAGLYTTMGRVASLESAVTFGQFMTAVPHMVMGFMGHAPDGTIDTGEGKRVVQNELLYRWWRPVRNFRLTALAAGAATLLAGGARVADGLRGQDAEAIYVGAMTMFTAAEAIGFTSILYLIDKKPGLLDKAPAWKRALGSMKRSFSPAPVPVSVKN